MRFESVEKTDIFVLVCDTHEKPGALYGEVGLSREWELCNRLTLVTLACIGFYDAFTKDQRKTYDKFNGFIAVAGCRLAVEF